MSNQIVISSGAKVRSLEGVLTGTAGIVNSVPLGGANGVATLDSMGKVPLSQLPASVVTYLGTWNAATNTPTLTNGVGDVGDLYICNVAGTVNFGAGPITFAVGDWVIYNGSQWQKSAGASGTVTSVAVTESGDALTITGSPITTSGTINIGFAGTGSQYIKGDGTLATFPTTIDQAKRLITEVYNSTGATLSKGTVVYINGGQGNLPTVTKAQANADNTSAQTYGVVQSDITNNNNGFVVVFGSLTDLDTQAYAVGTQLYLSGTTAGDWTSTKPSAPIHLVYVGIVVRSHPTQGVVEIRIQNGYELEELHDVAISAPVNNQGIFYNSSTDLWENKSIATALGYTPANDALVVHLAGTETITGAKTIDNSINIRDFVLINGDGGSTNGGLAIKQYASAVAASTGYTSLFARTSQLGINYGAAFNTFIDGSGLTANRTLTIPDASGTLALTSNLSSYVPYTGATTNVDLGSNFLKARTFYSEGSGGGGSYAIKNGTTPSFEDGYTILSSNDYRLNIVSTVSAATKAVYFGFSGVTATRTYTLPDASGTLALTSNLSSYVPYTGATADVNLGNTYSLSANNITSAGVLKSDFGLQLKSGLTTTISGYLSISAQKVSTNSQLNVYTDTGFYFSLIAPNTANYSYTYPASSGTLVLGTGTTNYLPKFTGASTIGDSLVYDNGTVVAIGSNAYSGGAKLITYQSSSNTAETGIMSITTDGAMAYLADVTTGHIFRGDSTIAGVKSTKFRVTNAGAATFSSFVGVNGSPATAFPLEAYINSSTAYSSTSRGNVMRVYNSNTGANVFAGIELGGAGTANDGLAGLNAVVTGSGSAALTFYTRDGGTFAERFRVAASGNVGIGTSSPDNLLDVYGTGTNTTRIRVRGTTNFALFQAQNDSSSALYMGIDSSTASGFNVGNYSRIIWSGGAYPLVIATNDAERMRITSDGRLCLNTTAAIAAGRFSIVDDCNQVTPIEIKDTATSNSGAFLLRFVNSSNAVCGSIAHQTSTTVQYNTSSDYRLKTDLRDYDGLGIVSKIKTYDFEWIEDGNRMYGVLAHELAEIIPYAVNGEKDGEQMQGADYSKIVPVLVKAIQEQNEIITKQGQAIEELKALINK